MQHLEGSGTTVLYIGRTVNATSRPLYTRDGPGSHSVGGWVGPMAVLDGCEIIKKDHYQFSGKS